MTLNAIKMAVLLPFFAAVQCGEISLVFLLVYLKVSRRSENLIFSLLSFLIAGMIWSTLEMQEAVALQSGLMWYRIQFICVMFGTAAMIHFVVHVIREAPPRWLAPRILYSLAAFFALLVFNPLVLHLPPSHSLPSNIDRDAPGSWFYPYAVAALVGSSVSVFVGLRGWLYQRRTKNLMPETFRPLTRHLPWIVAGILLMVLAAIYEVVQMLIIPENQAGLDLPINPRSVAANIFCAGTAWALGREVILSEEHKTRLQIKNQSLEQLAQARLQMTNDVQHEIKNKISSIALPLKVFLRQTETHGYGITSTMGVRTALEETEELDRIVKRMLNTARISAGFAPQLEHKEPTDVLALIQLLCRQREHQIEQELLVQAMRGNTSTLGQTLSFRVEAALPGTIVLVHADTLKQVLMNLLDNAVKYTPQGGEIIICIWRDQNTLHLSVTDPGVGMTLEECRLALTKPFYRVEDAAYAVAGTGLGLNLVQRLMQAQGGTLRIETQKRVGTVCHLTLPWEPHED